MPSPQPESYKTSFYIDNLLSILSTSTRKRLNMELNAIGVDSSVTMISVADSLQYGIKLRTFSETQSVSKRRLAYQPS